MTGSDDEAFAKVVRRFYPRYRLRRAWALEGGISAQATALEIALPDGRRKTLVLRRHSADDLRDNPEVALHEFKLLHVLKSSGLAVPTPCHLDPSGEIFGTPYVVLEYIEGDSRAVPSDLGDHMRQLAAQLAMLHDIQGADPRLSFLSKLDIEYAEIAETAVGDSLSKGRIRNALRAAWPLSRRNAAVLLHGDFWPGNVLWMDGRIVGVIDWEDAAVGDPLADLAIARLELFCAYGMDAIEMLTEHYRSVASVDFSNLVVWDLYAALRMASRISHWGLDQATDQRMRERHRMFVAHALKQA